MKVKTNIQTKLMKFEGLKQLSRKYIWPCSFGDLKIILSRL